MSGSVLTTPQHLDPDRGVPTFWAHTSAWLHRERLDRELATGTPSWDSPRHAARALQLTGRAHRDALSEGLDRVLDDARNPSTNFKRLSCIVPCRDSILRCAPLLEDLSDVLHGDLPLHAQHVARLRVMSRDGIGPFYCDGRRAELTRALELISAGIVADD
ncbi:MAG TPA: hypothetical protein VMF07_07030 [Solirubrobacteraceae bacterium]|nr:hypothetical protein [Solirubrobacteraceae bacterium]